MANLLFLLDHCAAQRRLRMRRLRVRDTDQWRCWLIPAARCSGNRRPSATEQ